MKENFELTDDSVGVFAINLRFDLDDIQSIASESITGGGDDKKCDVVYVDKEREIAVIAQCYISQKEREAAPASKASDLNIVVAWLLSADISLLPETIKGRAEELRVAVRQKEIRHIYIWYVHNCPSSANVEKELRTVALAAKTAVSQLDYSSEIDIIAEESCEATLENLYVKADKTIIVTETINFSVTDAVRIDSKDWSTLVTTIPGKMLFDLYNKHQTNLFSANIRGYLGSRESDSNINNGIKTTAQNEPQNFYVYNNGITALVLDFEIQSRRGARKRNIIITGISIVNGAQTTGSIASLLAAPSDEILVPVRFVKVRDDDIISKVVRYNNSQNKLQAADFRSTDPIQERLRSEFILVPDAEYDGGRRGGASDAIKRSKFTLPAYTVGQSLAAFHGDPVTAYDKKSELWISEQKYRQIFTDKTTARHIVFCYSLLTSINDRRLALTQRSKNEPDALTAIENQNLGFLNKKGANYLLVYAVSLCMETILGRAIANKFDLHFRDNVSPAIGSVKWEPIVNLSLSLSSQLDAAFIRSRISNESIAKTIEKFVGVVDSIATIQEPTFRAFANDVALY